MPRKRISFGTDGWRSRTDVDFNDTNVRIVSGAIAKYLLLLGKNRGVFIGYDGREGSKSFARACAEVLSSFGIPSFVPPHPVPTPVAAFATLHFSLDGAVMITASHNPPIYNGIKFIPDYGGPASTDITSKIESLLPDTPPQCKEYQQLEGEGLISTLNPIPEYVHHLKSLLSIETSKLKVALDSMHGATSGIAERAFKELGIETVMVRGNIDPNFGGISPDPVPQNLEVLLAKVLSEKCHIGFAFDGDGDRLAAVTSCGTFLLANQILPLLYAHFSERRFIIGDAARTVATSHLIDSVAKKLGRRVIETPVGFKYISSLLRNGSVVIGGEESGGISFISHIPEKDGIASALLLLESVELSGKPLHTLLKEMYEKYGYVESNRLDLVIDPDVEISLEDIQVPEVIQDRKVVGINKIDGLKILLEEDSWILLRKSGTENVVRIYAEAKDRNDVQRLIDFGRNLISNLSSAAHRRKS
ncbi:MAG: phosphoglucomutase/phosphomannomutase family protein [Candidatus Verstraetearchaeota archaeon]|nr:phosphoglucomutase/phosphomannomutase family protein [Candidatus Verstraetearchaeota archaeon]